MEVLYSLSMGKLEPKAVNDYCRETTFYVVWARGMGLELAEVGTIMLCSYFRMTLSRGKRSRFGYAARWFGAKTTWVCRSALRAWRFEPSANSLS